MNPPDQEQGGFADPNKGVVASPQPIPVGPAPKTIEFYGGYQVYSETGVDLTLLRENLKRSVTQRWENNRKAVLMARAFAEAGRVKRPSQPKSFGNGPMIQEEPILRRLVENEIEFVVIGGLAMKSHGSAYITEDLDICYSRKEKNIAALAKAFEPLHPYLRGVPPGLPFHFDPPTIQAGLNFTLTTDLGDIDLLGEVSGVGNYDKVFAQSEEHSIYGLKIRVVSLDGLIASKKAAGRRKDQLHLLELEELKKMRESNQ